MKSARTISHDQLLRGRENLPILHTACSYPQDLLYMHHMDSTGRKCIANAKQRSLNNCLRTCMSKEMNRTRDSVNLQSLQDFYFWFLGAIFFPVSVPFSEPPPLGPFLPLVFPLFLLSRSFCFAACALHALCMHFAALLFLKSDALLASLFATPY